MSFVNEGSNRATSTSAGWRPSSHQVIGAVIGILALIFIGQNSKSGTIHFLLFEFTAPVWIAFLLILASGAVVGYVLRGVRQDRQAEKKAARNSD